MGVDNDAQGDERNLGVVTGIDVEKTANPVSPISAGDSVRFDITVSNFAPGVVTDASLTDNLPAGVDWAVGPVTGNTIGVSCQVTGAVGAEVLTCLDASMASGESFTFNVAGPTDAADCGTINNTAIVTTSNDGGDSDGASVVVQCPDVTVTKSPDGADIGVGDNAIFTIVVTNLGSGAAYDAHLSDNLPSGLDWAIGAPTGDTTGVSCNVIGALGSQILTCDDDAMATGDSFTVNVEGITDAADCGTLNNTATVGASNEPDNDVAPNSNEGSIVVNCEISVEKAANPPGPVNAGDSIGWEITVTNFDPGAVTGLSLSDPLPAGVNWTLGAVSGDTTGVSCAVNGPVGSEVLTCTDGSMATGDSFLVHVAGPTDAADCGTLNNTATVTTENDGEDSDAAPVNVVCPPAPTPAASLFSANLSDNGASTTPDLVLMLALILGLFLFVAGRVRGRTRQ